MNPGSPSDPNSTAVVIGAFAAADKDPGKVTAKGGKNPYDALRNFQLGCDAKQGERGAFGYLPDKSGKLSPNGLATTDGALAARGRGLLVAPAKQGPDPKPLACVDGAKGDAAKAAGRQEAADAAAAYLTTALSAGDQHLTSAMPGAEPQPDYGSTADAVIALAAGGHKDAAQGPLTWLQESKSGKLTWAKGDPGALAKLVLAAHAGGADPRAFGGADLVEQLNATGPTPAAVSSDGAGAKDGENGKDDKGEKDDKDDDGGGAGVWWVVGVGLVAGIGIGFLLSGRKKQRL